MPSDLGQSIRKFGSRVLVLDDDRNRLLKFSRNLVGTNFVLVTTAEKAIECLKNYQKYDWVFLDHDLGGHVYVKSGLGTGYEVAQWIRDNPNKAPKNIVIHSFNDVGAMEIKKLLPEAILLPGAWDLIG